MAYTDKNLVITPSVGSSTEDPKIVFSGADNTTGVQSLTARIYPTSNGTLAFEGSSGQLFSITNSQTGTVYSVNDGSGLPSIEVFDTGIIRLARYSGRVLIGNITDNGVDNLQFGANTSINLSSINSNGTISAIRYTSNVATGTAPLTVSSTTLVANLNVDQVDGKDIGTLSAAGGIVYASSTTALAGTAAGTAGQAVISGGAGAPTFQTVASGNGASTIVARDANGSFTAGIITATTFSGSGASLTSLPAGQLSGTIPTGVLGNSSLNIGTTSVTLNRASANLALTGITSIAFPGSTSGTATLQATAAAGTPSLSLPTATGTLVGTGDTGTVTNTMLAGSIATSKITGLATSATTDTTNASNITSGTLANARTSAASGNGASTIVARDASGNFTAGTITATTFSGSGASLTNIPNSATTATSASTASAIVARDASGNFTAGTITATTFSGSGASLTSLPAGQLSGTIPSAVLGNSSLNIGTTSVALNRASADQAITGITAITGSTVASTNFTIKSGDVASNAPGNTIVTSGSPTTSGSFNSGAISINSGPAIGTGTAGSVSISAGDSGTAATTAGNVNIQGGTSGSASSIGTGGNVTVWGGSTPSGVTSTSAGGNVNIFGGRVYASLGARTGGNVWIDGGNLAATSGYSATAGKVYIGTSGSGTSGAGTSLVDIGNASITTTIYGTLKLPGGSPGAGKYLQSDASGNASWQTVVAGATITNDTTTNSDGYYLGMATATSGAWTAAYTSSTKLYFNPSTGQLNATNFNSLSDATKKENVKTIENATEKTIALRGVTFDWIDTKRGSLGVIAQEVEQIVPDAVSTSSSGEKSVNYGSLVGLLIETIKEQNVRIEALEAIIAAK